MMRWLFHRIRVKDYRPSSSGLECVHLHRNVSDHPAMRVMDVISRIPPLREYFTNNVYAIWRKPNGLGRSPNGPETT